MNLKPKLHCLSVGSVNFVRYNITLKMETASTSEISMNFYQTT
jgi:hypothetical protein